MHSTAGRSLRTVGYGILIAVGIMVGLVIVGL